MTDARTNDLVSQLRNAHRFGGDKALYDRTADMVERQHDALTKAVEVIKVWHNMGGNEGVWEIYWMHSPEMRPIREALSALLVSPKP